MFNISNCDILILYEHVQRELKNACILKVLLERKGYSVRIDNIAWRKGILSLLYRPKLIIHPSCHNGVNVSYIKHNYIGSYNGGYKILNLYSEQLTYAAAKDILAVREDAVNIYHIAWGEYTYKKLIEYGVEADRISITGSQRLDYLNSRFKKLNLTREELANRFDLDINKKWAMVIGNFAQMDIDYDAEMKGGNDFYFYKELQDITKKTYYELIKWYRSILTDKNIGKDIELIYRHHPNEVLKDEIIALSKEFKNFHIIGDLTISDWIINIDLAYVWTSTSSVEVAFAGIPVICMMPFDIKECYRIPLIDSLEKVKNIDELISITGKALNNELSDYNAAFIKNISYYYSKDDTSASEKIVSFVKRIIGTDKYVIMPEFSIIKSIPKTLIYIYKMILMALNIKTKKEHTVRYRDYRSQKFIEDFCSYINKLFS